jgi:hypothetical protein
MRGATSAVLQTAGLVTMCQRALRCYCSCDPDTHVLAACCLLQVRMCLLNGVHYGAPQSRWVSRLMQGAVQQHAARWLS